MCCDDLNDVCEFQQYDQKNIRRRVYDALNVLMAMNIISKEKKEIKWLGLPTNSLQECLNLVNEKKQRIDRVKQKTKQLQEIILQVCGFKLNRIFFMFTLSWQQRWEKLMK